MVMHITTTHNYAEMFLWTFFMQVMSTSFSLVFKSLLLLCDSALLVVVPLGFTVIQRLALRRLRACIISLHFLIYHRARAVSFTMCTHNPATGVSACVPDFTGYRNQKQNGMNARGSKRKPTSMYFDTQIKNKKFRAATISRVT